MQGWKTRGLGNLSEHHLKHVTFFFFFCSNPNWISRQTGRCWRGSCIGHGWACIWLRQLGDIFEGAPQHGREALCGLDWGSGHTLPGYILAFRSWKLVLHPLVMEWGGEEGDKL